MHLVQFLAAWLFPGAQCLFAVEMATAADSSQPDRAPSSSPSFSGNNNNAPGSSGSSSLSSPSSWSSNGGHSGSCNKSRSRHESPSTTPLCFGAGGAGRRLLRGSRARAPAKQDEEEAAATTAPTRVKGDVVGRCLRKISKRLRKARSDDGGKASPSSTAAVDDDTARERAESVARAISYCKDTLRPRTQPSPSPPPSPSIDDDWLHDRQEEIVASAAAAAARCDERSRDPRRPFRAAAGWPLGMQQTMAKRLKESPCSAASPTRDDGSLAAAAAAHGEESPPHHGHGRSLSLSGSLLATRQRTSADANATLMHMHV
jgi:hypothetical protein